MYSIGQWFADRDAQLSEEDARFMRERRGKDLALEYQRVLASGLTPFQELAIERRKQLHDTWDWYFNVRHDLIRALEDGDPMDWHEAERRVDDMILAVRTQVTLSARGHEWEEDTSP